MEKVLTVIIGVPERILGKLIEIKTLDDLYRNDN